jgi:hypothetical protein
MSRSSVAIAPAGTQRTSVVFPARERDLLPTPGSGRVRVGNDRDHRRRALDRRALELGRERVAHGQVAFVEECAHASDVLDRRAQRGGDLDTIALGVAQEDRERRR